jgi:ribonucleoside-diphosphate reductase beta chain
MSLLETSKSYVPVYPEFVEVTRLHEELHWHEGEAKLQEDVEQWKTGKITDQEKYFINSILRLFVQSDVAVGGDYYDNLIPVFKNNEVRNMLGSFAGREGVHQRAYALLSDTLGFGDNFYQEFLEYEDMKEK